MTFTRAVEVHPPGAVTTRATSTVRAAVRLGFSSGSASRGPGSATGAPSCSHAAVEPRGAVETSRTSAVNEPSRAGHPTTRSPASAACSFAGTRTRTRCRAAQPAAVRASRVTYRTASRSPPCGAGMSSVSGVGAGVATPPPSSGCGAPPALSCTDHAYSAASATVPWARMVAGQAHGSASAALSASTRAPGCTSSACWAVPSQPPSHARSVRV